MKKKVLIAIAIISSCLGMESFYQPKDNVLSQSEKKSGWKLLFDGKTLNGWRMYQNISTECWGINNGELYCKGDNNEENKLRADIVTTEQYENFELSVDWKIAPESNSGILYHVTEKHQNFWT